MLAESDAAPLWGLSAPTRLSFVRCETEQEVDDVQVGTSLDGYLFGQAKHTLTLSETTDSDLASALGQFVRQYLSYRDTPGIRPWERALDINLDRFLLITGSHSPGTIRQHLQKLLVHMRGLVAGQPLLDAATNNEQRRALQIVTTHVNRSWQAITGVVPTEAELQSLLVLIHVQVLDVAPNGDQEREARDQLRAVVVERPEQADNAWTEIINQCAESGADQTGFDRVRLQQYLLQVNIGLRAARSYQADIQRLRNRTDLSLQLIARHAVLPFSSGDQPIQRECAADLLRIARNDSLLIVGEPGAGKSGVIYDFARTLTTDKQDVLFLVADDLDAGSLGSLRDEIGLERHLIDVLDNWPGMEPAYLIIDSLDSVRDTRVEPMLHNLMRTVMQRRGRWHVVVSIRKYDLRYSHELKDLFFGSAGTVFQDPEFSAMRHINVPRLSDAELAQITSHSVSMLIDIAPPALQELLRIPFNLRLIADLLDTGVDPAEISPIQTQLELLNRYWEARGIGNDGQGDARDDILRAACSRMVSARALRCERTQLATIATSQLINALLRSHVLIEQATRSLATAGRSSLVFSHHVLFDYAVARLLLYDDPQSCPARLADDPDLVLFIQPSFLLLYRMLWSEDERHDTFWNLAFQMMEENRVPPIAQTISCICVAELTTHSEDLAGLWGRLYSTGGAEQTVAERLFGHLIGALQTDPESLIFPKAKAWCEVTEYVTRSLRPAIAYPARLLILLLSEKPQRLPQPQLTNLGLAARRLLEFAWSEPQRNEILVRQALQAVCRTCASDPVSATTILERCLQDPQLSQYGYTDLSVIARNLDWILAVAPELVGRIYSVTFSHEETSDAPTSLSGSRIMNMISTRRQDFEGARYQLTQHFPSFLARQPFHATRALLVVLAAYIGYHHTNLLPATTTQTFDVDGRVATIRADYSEMWDEGHRHHENALQMLDAFEQYLDALSQDEQQRTNLRALVTLLVMLNPLAIVWRRVLRSAARYPATLGVDVRPLAWAMPLLGYATRAELGHFIAAVYPLADQNDRERMEQMLLSAPDAFHGERRTIAEAWRDRVIRSLPHELILPPIQAIRAQIGAPDESQDDTTSDDPFTWIADISTLTAVPRRVEGKFGELALPIHQFLQQYTDETVNEEGVEAVFLAICTLYNALQQPPGESADDKMAFNKAWDTLALACGRVVALKSLDCQDERGILLQQMLLMSSQQAHPIRGMIVDASFEETPHWGEGYARIESAVGLMRLVSRAACADKMLLEALNRLCHDPIPAVRYQVAVRLLSLLRIAPDLAWSLLEELCQQEISRGVLQHVCSFVLHRLAGSYPERIIPLAETIFNRIVSGPGAPAVRTQCTRIFLDLDLWIAHPACRTRIQQIVSDPVRFKDPVQHILGRLRRMLTYGLGEPADPAQEVVRARAFEILRMLIGSAHSAISRLESALRGTSFDAWPPEATEEMRSLMLLFDTIARELYFASGAFDAHRDRRPDEEPALTDAQRRRFYIEVEPLINEIAEVSYPSITDHLVELLEACISFDPGGVFLHIATVIRHGQSGGYETESIAADRVVSLVERYLAEYRSLLHQDEACRQALMDMLSIFVGWPQARRLIYRLDEIYR